MEIKVGSVIAFVGKTGVVKQQRQSFIRFLGLKGLIKVDKKVLKEQNIPVSFVHMYLNQ